MAAKRTSEQFEFIHFLRGVAPLLVLWAHLGDWLPLDLGYDWWATRAWANWVTKPLFLFQGGGHLGVILFFLISGFVVTHASMRETTSSFLIRRVFRLFPLLAVTLAIVVVATLALRGMGLHIPLGVQSISPAKVLLNFTLTTWLAGAPYVLSVTWTLFIEVTFYVITACLIPATINRPFASSAWAIGGTAAAVAIGWLAGLNLDLLIYLPILWVGRCLYFAHQGFSGHWVILIIAAWLGFIGLYILVNGDFLWTFSQPPLFTYVYAMTIFLLSLRILKKTPAPLRFVADTSYSIYMLHLPVGSTIAILLSTIGMDFSLIFVLAIAGCLGVSWATYNWIEVPFQAIGRGLSRQRQVRAA